MTAKHRLEWAKNHWDVIVETETGTARLTLDELLEMTDTLKADLLLRDEAAPQRPAPRPPH